MFVMREVADLPPGSAVDVACGEGRNCLYLAGLGWQVTGIDFSPVAIDRARSLAATLEPAPDVDYLVADATLGPLPVAPADLVIVVFLQLPADERRRALRAAAGTVDDGGTLLVIAHHSRNLTDGVGGPQDPAVLYRPDDVVTDLEGTGLTIDQAADVERPVATDAGARSAIDLIVRAHR
jgi:SAM-dependent methyltransferase